MDLSNVHPGDIIEAKVKGHVFLAFVERKEYGSLMVNPVQRDITYRRVTSLQVLRLWNLSKQRPRSRLTNPKEAVHG